MPAAHPKEFRRCAVGLGPPVILDLRPRYPVWCSVRPRPGAGVHRRIVRHRSTSYPLSLPPFPMCPALPDSQYYGGSASLGPDRSTTNPAPHPHAGRVSHAGKAGNLPVSLAVRSPKEAPGYLPAAPAGDYSVVLRRPPHPGKVTRPPSGLTARHSDSQLAAPAPYPPGWRR